MGADGIEAALCCHLRPPSEPLPVVTPTSTELTPRGAPDSALPGPASAATPRPAPAPATIALCILLTWLFPGLGHWCLGHRKKGLLYFALLTFTFLFGVWLAGGRNVRNDDDFGLFFLGEALYAGLAFPALWLTKGLQLDANLWLDCGVLYSTVAGIMNVCVMVDVYETACPRSEASP